MREPIDWRQAVRQRLLGTAVHWSFVRAVGGVSIVRASGGALLFVSQLLLASWMGAENFGIYSFAWACVAILGTLAGLGMPGTSVRFIAKYGAEGDPSRLRGLLRFCRANTLLAAMITTSIAMAVIAAFPGESRYAGRTVPFVPRHPRPRLPQPRRRLCARLQLDDMRLQSPSRSPARRS